MPRVTPGTKRTTTEVLEPLPQAPAVEVEPREIAPAPEDQSFWDWMQSTTADEWEKKVWSCYIYRLEPPAGKVVGEPAFLIKYVRPFTLEEVQAEFGGGKYMYWMKERGMKHMYRGNFRIGGDPKSPLQLGASDAQGITPVLKMFADELNKRRDSGADATTATKQAMEILTTAYRTGLETVGKSSEPLKITEVIDAVSKLQNLSVSKNSTIMETLMAKLVERMVNPPDPLASLTPMLEMVDRLGGGGSRGDWRVSIAQNLPTVMQHLKEIAHDFALASQANAVAAQRTLLTPTGTAPAAPEVPTSAPAAARSMTVATPQGPLPLDPLNPPGGEMPNPQATGEHDTWLKQMIVQKILQGWTGEDLHGWLADTAPGVIEELKPHSVDEIVFYFGSDPVLRLAPQGTALRKVIEDFLKFANEEEPPKPN